ncbi:18544_t:CDS:2 [Gigaspora margarita]|uniref:18544_t:CDS:1 n=1 Tax=Gigaspora margarita TaxID=4874 RepID=A0ABN7VHB2_GIGMA|nr:18544_t:CDS:2 [Gigaspora margarita]
MNSQIEILKIQKRKLIKQYDFPKKRPKTSIESKMIENANEVKNVHFLTLVLNYINDTFTFFFISLLDVLQDYCLDHWNFYKPTPIFKTRVNYDFCEYLVDELDPLVDSSIVEAAEIKLCLNCTIKKKEFLFNSIRQLENSIYVKLKEVKYTKFFYKDVIRVVLRNLYKILKKDYLYIEKYGRVVKTYDFPKNL